MTADDLLTLIDKGGSVAVLVAVLFAIVTRRWLVPAWAYRELAEREAEWKRIALTGTSAAKVAVELAREATQTGVGGGGGGS